MVLGIMNTADTSVSSLYFYSLLHLDSSELTINAKYLLGYLLNRYLLRLLQTLNHRLRAKTQRRRQDPVYLQRRKGYLHNDSPQAHL